MAVTAGTRLGPYEIRDVLGKGGMGEVYRARDTRLNRDVALKVSAEQFSERFEREARVIASLNHPNICALYDVGPNYLVMELIEGESPRGPMPLDSAIDYARQIASALEAAHDKGVVHRDLKPANIKVTREGIVKVLDFGLAKVAPAEGSGTESSPTLTMGATQAGAILGTAAYMAPEQARGKEVDKRADIWSFGVVLHEMLTGRRLFQGEDLTDTLASVVRDKPDLSDAPAEVRRLLEKCLEKDPQKRLRDISGAALLLELAGEPGAAAEQYSGGARGWIPWVVAAAALAAGSALAFVHFRESAPASQSVQFEFEAPQGWSITNEYGGIAPSPDGRYVVFCARGADVTTLWLRALDSKAAREIPGTDRANYPAWSPDSRSVVFFAGGKLKRVDIAGGAPVTLGDALDVSVTPSGAWNRDGVILFGSPDGLKRISSSGGEETLVTKIDPAKHEEAHGFPQFLPDGDRFLYFIDSSEPGTRGLYAASLRNPGQRQLVLRTNAKAVYVPAHGASPATLLWLQDQTLLAQRFNDDSLKLEGNPVPVAEQIGFNRGTPIRAAFWASAAGLLVYDSNPEYSRMPILSIGGDGKIFQEVAAADAFESVALAPGAQRMALALTQNEGGAFNTDVYVRDLAKGSMTRLTFDPAPDRYPVWSPDGKEIAFSSSREGGVLQIYRKDASGVGQEERLTSGPGSKFVLDWSKDGKYILYRQENSGTSRDLFALPMMGEHQPVAVLNSQYLESTGAISPDGKWIAFASNDSGHYEIYVQAFPGGGSQPKGRWQISNGAAYDVKWRGDGKELYWESGDGKSMMAAEVEAGPQGIRSQSQRKLFSIDFQSGSLRQFDVTPDGQRFLMIAQNGEAPALRLTVISNWQFGVQK